MVYPAAVQLYVKRLPGVQVSKVIYRLPNAQQMTPGSRCQMQIPRCDAWDTRSAQLLGDVSTAGSNGEFVLPRYGAQALIDNSTILCGGQSIGSQNNNLYNFWNHIKQDLTSSLADQSKNSVYNGWGDVPQIGSTASGPTFDLNGTYTPATITKYTGAYGYSGASVLNPTQAGVVNQYAKDATTGLGYYKNGQPFVIEVFNETLESICPELLPTNLMQNAYVDIGWSGPHVLCAGAAPSSGSAYATYTVQNLAMQSTCYTLGEAFRSFSRQFLDQGEVLELPFKSVQAVQGSLTNNSMDIQLNLSVVSQSIDGFATCFLDPAFKANPPGPASIVTNTAATFKLGRGTGVKEMGWTINGQNYPAYRVTPKSAYAMTMNDMGLTAKAMGSYKNLNSPNAYLQNWFVWYMATNLPFKEDLLRAISGMNTLGSNSMLSLNITSDSNVPSGTFENYACIPLVFVVSTQTLLISNGGVVAVQV